MITEQDEREIIKLSCDRCPDSKEGTYKELFGDLPSLILLFKPICKCGGTICIQMTGKYKVETK